MMVSVVRRYSGHCGRALRQPTTKVIALLLKTRSSSHSIDRNRLLADLTRCKYDAAFASCGFGLGYRHLAGQPQGSICQNCDYLTAAMGVLGCSFTRECLVFCVSWPPLEPRGNTALHYDHGKLMQNQQHSHPYNAPTHTNGHSQHSPTRIHTHAHTCTQQRAAAHPLPQARLRDLCQLVHHHRARRLRRSTPKRTARQWSAAFGTQRRQTFLATQDFVSLQQ